MKFFRINLRSSASLLKRTFGRYAQHGLVLFRKFSNSLDVLANHLNRSINTSVDKVDVMFTSNEFGTNISVVNIPQINGFGSLKAPSLNNDIPVETSSSVQEMIKYDQYCSTNDDCQFNLSSLICRSNRCLCPENYFWSSTNNRCLICHDLLIGSRCFRLSNHKSTWYQANDYCENIDSTISEQEYRMRLASNLNRTDIEYLRDSFAQMGNQEQLDYIYWIGATSYLDTKKLHQLNSRNRRHIVRTIFRWFHNQQAASINLESLWCSQMNSLKLDTVNKNELCISITGCGLYADDCQRNYRYICEAL